MSYNEKSRENLVPFKTGYDSRRQVGRKRGSLNMRTVVKNLLNEDISPDMIFSPATRERVCNMNGMTYLEGITMTLINQSLDGNPQASNILMRELRKVEEKEPKEMELSKVRELKITVVESREEVERLDALQKDLARKFGEDYEDLVDYPIDMENAPEWASKGF